MTTQQWLEENVWGLLLAERWKATMGSRANKGARFYCMSVERGGGIDMGSSSVGDYAGKEDGKCGMVSRRVIH